MKVSLNWIRYYNNKYGSAADPMPKGGINEYIVGVLSYLTTTKFLVYVVLSASNFRK